MNIFTLLPVALASSIGINAMAGYVTIIEPNDTFASAMNLDAYFDLEYDELIHDADLVNTSEIIPHASVAARGRLSSPYHYFSFSAQAGSLMILDADYASYDLDLQFRLYAPTETLLEFNDDFSWGDDPNPGSLSTYDSFIQLTAPSSGMYYLEVSQVNGNPIDEGQDYYLHVSRVPDSGSSLALLTLCVLGLAGCCGRALTSSVKP